MSFSQKNIDQSADEMVVNLIAPNDDYTASIELDNSFFQKALLSKKIILSYGQFDNTAVPLFIPKKLNEMPSYVNQGALLPPYDKINVNSINYVIALGKVNDINHIDTKWAIAQWSPINPTLIAPYSLPNQKQVYQNKYYYSYTVSHILKIIETPIAELYKSVHNLTTLPPVKLVFNGTSITLVIPDKIAGMTYTTYIWINQELRNLLQVNNYKITENPAMNIIVSDSKSNVEGTDSSLHISRFLSREWTAFDTVLITTSLPLKSVEYQTNLTESSGSSTEYRNVVFALNTLEGSVNFYPYYSYEADSTDIYKTFSQNIFNQPTFTLDFFLFNKRNGLSIPYKLNKDGLITLDFLIRNNNE